MRFFYLLASLTVLISCSERKEAVIQKKVLKPKITDPKKHIGFWIHEKYIESLRQTKSTKKTSESGFDNFYSISDKNEVMQLNLHEGWGNYLFVLTSDSIGNIYNSDSTELYQTVKFTDNYMVIEGKKYIKAPQNKDGFDYLVNSAFIAGRYQFNGKEVHLKQNGNIDGIKGIKRYKLNTDYMDAGMQYDKIYLYKNEGKQPETYIYSMQSDTLKIIEINCKEMIDFCVVIEKGEVLYTLVKK